MSFDLVVDSASIAYGTNILEVMKCITDPWLFRALVLQHPSAALVTGTMRLAPGVLKALIRGHVLLQYGSCCEIKK
jgi:hypothetical protein